MTTPIPDILQAREAVVRTPSDPAARGCPHAADCVFAGSLRLGGDPCNRCRHLVAGDYHVSEEA